MLILIFIIHWLCPVCASWINKWMMNDKVTAMSKNYVLFQTITHANYDSKLNYLKAAHPGERDLKGDLLLTSRTEGMVLGRQGIGMFKALLLGWGEGVLRQGIENVSGETVAIVSHIMVERFFFLWGKGKTATNGMENFNRAFKLTEKKNKWMASW